MTAKPNASACSGEPLRLSRRLFATAALGAGFALGSALVEGVGPGSAVAQASTSATAQKIADHFSSVRSMSGEFIQFGPRGDQTAGTFSMVRPGKLRFDYEPPAAYRVISNGHSVFINNRKLKTWDFYPLNKTPLKLLLNDRIDLKSGRVKSVKVEEDLMTLVLADKSVFGNSQLTMMFDPNTYELRQWTITDAQGKDTTVMIFNVQEGAQVDPKLFKVNEDQVRKSIHGGRGR